ncbi:hypothetical protein WS62_29755 [Burkholderia sp. ABCPW 14]|uniref:hypothetical protein n=1 Tax=Burkholderia sp. ABCPW 14 TaxID=1637860 RepID=UPI000770BD70|nr:hypothetical protein [Burkholderia sp. ABCPW 14]KVD78012.1 hypothetical protein WS62_29755 [Burkholderia sp. ABCPW 14]
MKRFGEAKKLLSLLQRRVNALRWEMQQHRDALADVDRELAGVSAEIDGLKEQLARAAFGRCYERSALMRARGKQAVARFGIACRKMAEADLIERRGQIEQALQASRQEALALEQRQNKHRDWLARQRLQYDMLRESMIEAELMEGRVHANQRYQ